MNPKSSEIPHLKPPGAGVPFWESLFYRVIVGPLLAGREDPAVSRKRFIKLHDRIREVYLSISDSDRTKRILVPAQGGLEDSSRYWSAAMVLEHVVIVGRGMQRIIQSLSHGEIPNVVAEAAAVKPFGTALPEETFRDFEALRISLLSELDSGMKNLDSPTTFRHPWFGQLTARKWFWVLGQHAGVHLKQMKAIREGITLANSL